MSTAIGDGGRCTNCKVFVPYGENHGCTPYPATPSPHPWGPSGISNPLQAVVDALVDSNRLLTTQNTALAEQVERMRVALSRHWTLGQYEYADAHDLWAEHAGDGTADEQITSSSQEGE